MRHPHPGTDADVHPNNFSVFGHAVFAVVTMHSQVSNPEFRTILAHRRGEQSVFGGCSLRMENSSMNVLIRLSNGTRNVYIEWNDAFPESDVGPSFVRQQCRGARRRAIRLVLPVHRRKQHIHRTEMHSGQQQSNECRHVFITIQSLAHRTQLHSRIQYGRFPPNGI